MDGLSLLPVATIVLVVVIGIVTPEEMPEETTTSMLRTGEPLADMSRLVLLCPLPRPPSIVGRGLNSEDKLDGILEDERIASSSAKPRSSSGECDAHSLFEWSSGGG